MSQITATSLPQWSDMALSFFGEPDTDRFLGKPWCRSDELAIWFSRSSWSLAYLFQTKKAITGKEQINVWIPDYFCNSALVKLRELGCVPVFYPLSDDLSPDLSACTQLVDSFKPDIFVLVHFFGKPVEASNSLDLCKKAGAWLVEDATHVLKPAPGVGEVGDAVMYSPYKYLPLYDGAVLVLRPKGPAVLDVAEMLVKANHEAKPDESRSESGILYWLFKRALQKINIRRRTFSDTFNLDADLTPGAIPSVRMSRFSRRMLSRILDNLENFEEVRLQRLADWQGILQLIDCPAVLNFDDNNSSSYQAVLQFSDKKIAKSYYSIFLAAGIPVTTWPDLPPEIINSQDNHKKAILLRQACLYLPIHQTITRKQIIRAGKKLSILSTSEKEVNPSVKTLVYSEWAELWHRCSHTNMMQSWEYGAAKEEVDGWQAIRLKISAHSGEPIALVQVLVRSLPALGKVARINRGPLAITIMEEEGKMHKIDAIKALLIYAKEQNWRVMQIAPELPGNAKAEILLQFIGFTKLQRTTWGSALLSLQENEDDLLMHLKGKWRNGMRKGLKQGVIVRHGSNKGEDLELLLDNYRTLQNDRKFGGLSEELLRALASQQGNKWQFNLYIGIDESKDEALLGTLVTIRSGDTTTYLIGTTTDVGRKVQANSVLLWEAILHAKASGCDWFDVGGLNADTPTGIADFKKGLNASPYELAGEWRGWKYNL
jgi:lipid II:glycine glycyltransferase (peptidoglycan interpeptide bridge formation enzyme)/dTDP-4-amino-4,6-dideoxygalactose transaminase